MKTELDKIDLEKKPRMLNKNLIIDNMDENKSNIKPDIWVHEKIEYEKHKVAKLILDTVVTNIFCNKNLKNIENDNISFFMAGKIGENNKNKLYKNKFNNYYENGYKFQALALEILGGVNKNIRNIINTICKCKAKRLNKDANILINNTYILMSLIYKKFLIETLKNHIILV